MVWVDRLVAVDYTNFKMSVWVGDKVSNKSIEANTVVVVEKIVKRVGNVFREVVLNHAIFFKDGNRSNIIENS